MIKSDNQLDGQLNKAEEKITSSIHESFEKLEQSFSFSTPELQWFEQKIVDHKKQIRRKWRLDLIVFSTVALVILSVMFTTLFQMPILFLSLQGFTLFFLIGYTSYEFGKKREMKGHD